MTWFFLVLSLVLFCMRDFRVALESPLESLIPAGWTGDYGSLEASKKLYASLDVDAPLPFRIFVGLHLAGSLERLYTLGRYVSPGQFSQMAHAAEQRGDTEFMAFAALHLPPKEMREEILRFADGAAARDPKLTWLYWFVVYRFKDDWGSRPVAEALRARIDKLQAWAPTNAVPHLLRAELVRSIRDKNWSEVGSDPSKIRKVLEQDLEWQKEMGAAFAQPRYESYSLERFALERKVMLQHGWNHPAVAASILYSSPVVPNMMGMTDYARLLVLKFGAEAERAGQSEKAFAYYWQVERFGENLRLENEESQLWIRALFGMAIQRSAIDRLSPALKKTGREREAATLEYLLKQAKQDYRGWSHAVGAYSNSSAWSWLMVDLSALLTWIFFILSLASVVYVNAKLWIRRDKQGLIYRVLTVAENFLPLLLLVAVFGLYVSYTPIAQNFSYYMTSKEFSYDPRLLMDNAIPPFTSATLIGRLAG